MDTMNIITRGLLLNLLLAVPSVKVVMTLMLVLELLLLLDPGLTARDVLTKLRWLRRLNMTMLCSVTTPTTRGATPPMSPTTSPNRRRSAKRTSGRVVSLNMKQLLSTKLYKCAVHLL